MKEYKERILNKNANATKTKMQMTNLLAIKPSFFTNIKKKFFITESKSRFSMFLL